MRQLNTLRRPKIFILENSLIITNNPQFVYSHIAINLSMKLIQLVAQLFTHLDKCQLVAATGIIQRLCIFLTALSTRRESRLCSLRKDHGIIAACSVSESERTIKTGGIFFLKCKSLFLGNGRATPSHLRLFYFMIGIFMRTCESGSCI